MSNQPVPQNTAATQANKLLKSLENVLVPIAEAAIITAVPELGIPVVKQISQAIEVALADKLTKLAETGVTFLVIDVQTANENLNMHTAVALLARAVQSGDPNAIAKAKAQFDEAQDALASDDGSATPQ